MENMFEDKVEATEEIMPEEPVTAEPPAEESLAVEPVAEEPVQKEPVAEEPVKEKKSNKLWKSAVAGLIFGLCAGVVFLAIAFIGQKTFLKDDSTQVVIEQTKVLEEDEADEIPPEAIKEPEEPVMPVPEKEDIRANSIAQIVQNCMPSIVSITTKNISEISSFWGTRQYESEGVGSGIIVGKNDTELLVATNNHVVSGAKEVSVCFNDSEDSIVTAKVKGSDAANDLAVVAIPIDTISSDVLATIKVATVGDSASLQVGDQVVAIGNALGFGQSVTTGIISALDRKVEIEDLDVKLIQTDAAINPGNSGGALLNMKGELIGINSAKFASELVEGMGYAIPISTAQPILDNLMNRETRDPAGEKAGYLGVSVQDVSAEAAETYGIPKGAYVSSTEEGGAAQKAGIKKGDIITKFDGISITSGTELGNTIGYYQKGEQVEVTYMRSDNGVYKEMVVTVTLADSKQAKEADTEEPVEPTQPVEPENEDEFSVPEGEYQMPDSDQMEEFFRYFFGN